MADRVFFIDRNRGNDSNDGLSKNAAWASLSKIAAQTDAGPSDFFLIERESAYELDLASRIVPPTSWTGVRRQPVTIGNYSYLSGNVGVRPMISCFQRMQASDWTYNAPLNGWTATFTGTFVNSLAWLWIGDGWAANSIDQTPGTAVASIDGRFHYTSNTTLLLYAPAGTNPSDYYGEILYAPQAVGAITLSSGRKSIRVTGLHFEKAGTGASMYSGTTAAADFELDDCTATKVSSLAYANGDTVGVLRASIHDNEVWNFGPLAIHAYSTGGAGIQSVDIYGNRLRDGGHIQSQASIYVQVRNTDRSGVAKVHHNDISGYRWGTRDKGYDGCGIYCETGADGVQVFANSVHDQYCAYQDNSGRRNFWYGNVAYNVRLGFRLSDQMLNNQSDCRLINNTLLVGDLGQVPSQWGSAQGQEYPGIWMYKTSSTLNLTATNNIIANLGGQRGRAAFGLPDVYATSTYSLTNNWIYGFETDSLKASDNSAPSPAPTVTKAGTTDPTPYLHPDGRLRTPFMLDDIPMLNPLGAAGTYVQGVTLRNGRLNPGRVPVGAYAEGRY